MSLIPDDDYYAQGVLVATTSHQVMKKPAVVRVVVNGRLVEATVRLVDNAEVEQEKKAWTNEHNRDCGPF